MITAGVMNLGPFSTQRGNQPNSKYELRDTRTIGEETDSSLKYGSDIFFFYFFFIFAPNTPTWSSFLKITPCGSYFRNLTFFFFAGGLIRFPACVALSGLCQMNHDLLTQPLRWPRHRIDCLLGWKLRTLICWGRCDRRVRRNETLRIHWCLGSTGIRNRCFLFLGCLVICDIPHMAYCAK